VSPSLTWQWPLLLVLLAGRPGYFASATSLGCCTSERLGQRGHYSTRAPPILFGKGGFCASKAALAGRALNSKSRHHHQHAPSPTSLPPILRPSYICGHVVRADCARKICFGLAHSREYVSRTNSRTTTACLSPSLPSSLFFQGH